MIYIQKMGGKGEAELNIQDKGVYYYVTNKELDCEGRIATDISQKTDIKGIYAVGDIVSGVGHLELIIVAVAQGAVAAHNIYVELFEPYWA